VLTDFRPPSTEYKSLFNTDEYLQALNERSLEEKAQNPWPALLHEEDPDKVWWDLEEGNRFWGNKQFVSDAPQIWLAMIYPEYE
jgi:hypothetical protein